MFSSVAFKKFHLYIAYLYVFIICLIWYISRSGRVWCGLRISHWISPGL